MLFSLTASYVTQLDDVFLAHVGLADDQGGVVAGPDPAGVDRVLQAMMGMTKSTSPGCRRPMPTGEPGAVPL
jgi:hypothetical protein